MSLKESSALTASVVIPTLNRGEFLCDTLKSIVGIGGGSQLIEIIVIDQSKSHGPDTEQRLLELTREPLVRYHRVNFLGTTKARNYGVKVAKGDIVIFVDDDVYTPPGFIQNHLRVYEDSSIAGVAGCVIHEGECRLNQSDLSPSALLKIQQGREIAFNAGFAYDVRWARGCNMSFRRECIERVGGFDEGFFGVAVGEEPEFCHRLVSAGGRIRFVPETELFHRAASSGGSRTQEQPKKRFVEFIENGVYFWWCVHPNAFKRLRCLVGMAQSSLLNSDVIRSGRLLSYLYWFIQGCIAGVERYRSIHPNGPGPARKTETIVH